MPFRLTLLLLLVLGCNRLVAQSDTIQSRPHQLLWELTGPKMDKPSYIFGSMHVREPEAFIFPDSLWLCLESVDAFANEVHLDSAVTRVIEVYLGGAPTFVDSSYIKLTDSIRVGDDFMAGFEVPGSESIKSASSNTRPADITAGASSFPTFMDAYLMEQAKNKGKTLYGLEVIDHHLHDVDLGSNRGFSLFGPNRDALEKMYFSGDIMAIGELISEQPVHFDRLALVARNYIMANSIEQILNDQSSVFAVVGAAHLPGNTGLLTIMKERGYQLRPVTATFNNEPLDWKSSLPIRNWTKVVGRRALFSASTPTPFIYSGNTQLGEQFLNFDIGRGLTFLIMTNRMRPFDYEDFDYGFFELDGYEVHDKDLVELNGLSGYRYKLSKPGADIEHYIGYVFFKDQQMYYLQIGAYEKTALKVFAADEEILIESLETPTLHPGKWKKYQDPKIGFRASLPEQYVLTQTELTPGVYKEEELGRRMHIYHAGLGKEAVTTWLIHADLPAYNWAPSVDSLRLAEGIDWVSEYFSLDDIEDHIWDLEASRPQVSFLGQFQNNEVLLKGRLSLRGNRIFAVISIDTPDGKRTQKLMRDFAFVPITEELTFKQHSLADSLLLCWLPDVPISNTANQLENDTRLQAIIQDLERQHSAKDYHWKGMDPLTSAQVAIRVEKLPSLYGTPDTSAFFTEQLKSMRSEFRLPDQSTEVLVMDTYPGREYRLEGIGSHLVYVAQIYVANNLLVKKLVQVHADQLDHPNIEAFLHDDTLQEEELGPPTLVAKTTALLEALRSDNTDTLNMVLGMLISNRPNILGLEKDQVEQILLQNNFPNSSIGINLYDELLRAFQDDTRSAELDRLVTLFEKSDSQLLKEQILILLANDYNKESWQLYRDLLQTEEINSWSSTVFLPLYDRPEAIEISWPGLIELLSNGQNIDDVFEIGTWILSGEQLDKHLVLEQQAAFTKVSTPLFSQSIQQEDTKALDFIFDLYERLPTDAHILAQMNSLYERRIYDWLSVRSAGVLLAHGQTLGKRTMKKLLRSEQLRYPFLRLLNKYDAINSKAQSQYEEVDLAEFLLREAMIEIEDSVSAIRFDQVIDIMYQDSPYQVYLFTFSYEEDINRLAAVGLFTKEEEDPHFVDDGLIEFTSYTISSRRRARKGKQLIRSLELRRERENEDISVDIDL